MGVDTSIFYTGTDTNNGLPFPAGSDTRHFYIGRLGGELSADTMGFDIQAAKQATQTFGYWDLAGAESAPANIVISQWGQQQGHGAVKAVEVCPYVHGRTVFLDVESGNGGWGTGINSVKNQQVLSAALAAIKQSGYVPGVYISLDTWLTFFGPNYLPKTPFVLWLAGTNCPASAAAAAAQFADQPSIGGMRPMIWQYSVSGGGCPADTLQDLNVTIYQGWLQGRWEPTPDGMEGVTRAKEGITSLTTTVVKSSPVTMPGTVTHGNLQTALVQRLTQVATDLQTIIEAVNDGQL